jgi:hypothetical protein
LSDRSTGAGENDRYVIWLFGAANPLRHGVGDHVTDAREGSIANFGRRRLIRWIDPNHAGQSIQRRVLRINRTKNRVSATLSLPSTKQMLDIQPNDINPMSRCDGKTASVRTVIGFGLP